MAKRNLNEEPEDLNLIDEFDGKLEEAPSPVPGAAEEEAFEDEWKEEAPKEEMSSETSEERAPVEALKEATLYEATAAGSFAPNFGDGRPGQSSENPSMKAKWYVVHTYSGHENKVKVNIEKIVENRGMQDLILDIVVPTEDHVEIKNGQRKIKTRKMFPGYVIVKMIVTNESWYLVRNTQGVTGFVGHGSEPIPLSDEEVWRMGIEKISYDLDIEEGDSVKVINGPFESFMGVVEEVNMDKQTLKVRISMFGRDTPVELEFGQVDKI